MHLVHELNGLRIDYTRQNTFKKEKHLKRSTKNGPAENQAAWNSRLLLRENLLIFPYVLFGTYLFVNFHI